MFDLTQEQPLSLKEAARLIPPARNGKRTHLSTLLRWVLTGAKAPDGTRVRLDAVRLGGRWMTSREALQRFTVRLTPTPVDATAPAARTEGKRLRAAERARAELERMGV